MNHSKLSRRALKAINTIVAGCEDDPSAVHGMLLHLPPQIRKEIEEALQCHEGRLKDTYHKLAALAYGTLKK